MFWIIFNIITHQWRVHWGKNKKNWIKCRGCWTFYLLGCFMVLFYAWLEKWKINNKHMNDILQWILIIFIVSLPPVFVALINYYAEKKKKAAETERIKLENKIAKEITYDQLKTKSKHENIKNKIQIFQELTDLEEKLKASGKLTEREQKKLESLEMLKKEFKHSFVKEEQSPIREKKKNLQEKEEKVAKKQKLVSPKKKRAATKK